MIHYPAIANYFSRDIRIPKDVSKLNTVRLHEAQLILIAKTILQTRKNLFFFFQFLFVAHTSPLRIANCC